MSNELVLLLERFPDADWDWCSLSSNPNITLEYIDKHPHLPWVFYSIMVNPNLTVDYIEDHPEKPWDWTTLSRILPVDYIFLHPEKSWSWYNVSGNPTLTMKHISESPHIDWDWTQVNGSANLKEEDIKSMPDSRRNWWMLSYNSLVSADVLLPFVDEFLSDNSSSWYFLSAKIESFDVVFARPELPWNHTGLSLNPILTLPFVFSHPDFQWNWYNISKNANITMEDINTHIGEPWDWRGVAHNPNLTLQFIVSHPEVSWAFYRISSNPFKQDPHLKKKMPKLSHSWKLLLHELNETFDKPPNKYTLPIFRRGGVGYRESLMNATETIVYTYYTPKT